MEVWNWLAVMNSPLVHQASQVGWKILYFLVEIWFFYFPRFLYGWQGLERKQICANMKNLEQEDITDDFYEKTCKKEFRRTIDAAIYPLIYFLVGMFIYRFIASIFSALRFAVYSRFTQSKPVEYKPKYPPKSEESKQRGKDTLKINKLCRDLLQNIFNVVGDTILDDRGKQVMIIKYIGEADPILTRDLRFPAFPTFTRMRSPSIMEENIAPPAPPAFVPPPPPRVPPPPPPRRNSPERNRTVLAELPPAAERPALTKASDRVLAEKPPTMIDVFIGRVTGNRIHFRPSPSESQESDKWD